MKLRYIIILAVIVVILGFFLLMNQPRDQSFGSLSTGFKTANTIEVSSGWADLTVSAIATDNGSYAVCNVTCSYGGGDDGQMSDFTFGISENIVIDGIEVVAQMKTSHPFPVPGIVVNISLSGNDGVEFSSSKTNTVTSSTDTNYTYGGSTDLWGRTWSFSQLADGNFRARIDVAYSAFTLSLDVFSIKVYYTVIDHSSMTTQSKVAILSAVYIK